MGTTSEATAGESNFQSNVTSNVNTGGRHFSHFEIIGANPFRGFEAFGNNNYNPPSENNNNNNPLLPPLLSLPGFGGGLGEGFNLLSEGNARELDSNVAALVNMQT